MTVNESFLTMDQTTGMFTRSSFEYLLKRKIALAEECAEDVGLLLLDPDDAGTISQMDETFAGFFLKEIAARLKGCLRAGDIVAHFEGSQFMVILDEVENHDAAPRVARKIIQVLSATYPFGEGGTELLCSVGIVRAAPFDADETELVARAQKALLSAKAEGGNQFHYFIDALDALTRR